MISTTAAPAEPEIPSAEDLFHRHRSVANAMSRRYAGTPHAADIRQVADIALWKAATRFEAERGSFERFAAVTISGEIKKYLRRAGWVVNVGRRRQEDALRVRRLVDDLTVTLARTPSTADLVAATGWPTARVVEAMRCDSIRFAAPEPSDHVSTFDPGESLEAMIADLPVDDQVIVRLSYAWDLTQREIGEQLSMTQSTVHRRLRRAHRELASSLSQSA